jgi:hypothetical protein
MSEIEKLRAELVEQRKLINQCMGKIEAMERWQNELAHIAKSLSSAAEESRLKALIEQQRAASRAQETAKNTNDKDPDYRFNARGELVQTEPAQPDKLYGVRIEYGNVYDAQNSESVVGQLGQALKTKPPR